MTNEREAPLDEVIAHYTEQLANFEDITRETSVDMTPVTRRIRTILRALKEMQSRQGEAVAWINSNELVDMATGKLTASLVISARDEGYTAPLYSAPLLADPELALDYKAILENALLGFDKGKDTPAEIVGEAIARCQNISRYTHPAPAPAVPNADALRVAAYVNQTDTHADGSPAYRPASQPVELSDTQIDDGEHIIDALRGLDVVDFPASSETAMYQAADWMGAVIAADRKLRGG